MHRTGHKVAIQRSTHRLAHMLSARTVWLRRCLRHSPTTTSAPGGHSGHTSCSMGAGAEREIDTPASVVDLTTEEVGPAGAALKPAGRAAAAAAAAGGAGMGGPMYSDMLLVSGGVTIG